MELGTGVIGPSEGSKCRLLVPNPSRKGACRKKPPSGFTTKFCCLRSLLCCVFLCRAVPLGCLPAVEMRSCAPTGHQPTGKVADKVPLASFVSRTTMETELSVAQRESERHILSYPPIQLGRPAVLDEARPQTLSPGMRGSSTGRRSLFFFGSKLHSEPLSPAGPPPCSRCAALRCTIDADLPDLHGAWPTHQRIASQQCMTTAHASEGANDCELINPRTFSCLSRRAPCSVVPGRWTKAASFPTSRVSGPQCWLLSTHSRAHFVSSACRVAEGASARRSPCSTALPKFTLNRQWWGQGGACVPSEIIPFTLATDHRTTSRHRIVQWYRKLEPCQRRCQRRHKTRRFPSGCLMLFSVP